MSAVVCQTLPQGLLRHDTVMKWCSSAHLAAKPEGILMTIKLDILTIDVLKDKDEISQ